MVVTTPVGPRHPESVNGSQPRRPRRAVGVLMRRDPGEETTRRAPTEVDKGRWSTRLPNHGTSVLEEETRGEEVAGRATGRVH